MRLEFKPETLIGLANQSRHIETTAEHIVGMIDSPRVDVVTAIWAPPNETAVWIVKGADLVRSRVGKIRGLIAFWLRDEAHADALTQEIEHLVEGATTIRGEFAPIGEAFAFEGVPTMATATHMFVTRGGLRIARCGRPGTRERRRWISLIPDWEVRDLDECRRIEFQSGRSMLHFLQ
jgi:hypothetical protein